MLSLEELKNRENILPKHWLNKGRELYIIITETSSIVTNFMYNLMFRLEGMKVGSYKVTILILEDGKKVTNTDVRLGLYIESDLGKSRSRVLTERYNRVFTTRILRIDNVESLIRSIDSEDNYAVIGFGKSYQRSTEIFRGLLNNKIDKNLTGGLLRIHGTSERDNILIENTVYRVYGDVLGKVDIGDKANTKKNVKDIVLQNQIISQSMINFLNLLITDDETMKGLRYLTWEFNLETGKQNNVYNESDVTLFHKIGSYLTLAKVGITESRMKIFSDMFYENMEGVEERIIDRNKGIENEIEDYLNSYKDLWLIRLRDFLSKYAGENLKSRLFKSEWDEFCNKLMVYEVLNYYGRGIKLKGKKEETNYIYSILEIVEKFEWSLL